MSTLAASFGLRLSERATGVALAFATACVSGVAVYVNAKGVARFDDATVYTTAKDAVAGLALLALAAPLLATRPRTVGRAAWPGTGRQRLGVVTIAVIGGSVPFVLFFEGLARASATQAAFIHKTLVLWVAVLAVVLLRERLGPLHVLAIGLLMAGQVLLVPSLGVVTFGAGEAMILGATLLWAVEVILVKRLVTGLDPRTLAAARMGLGTLLLIAWVAVTGRGSELGRFPMREQRYLSSDLRCDLHPRWNRTGSQICFDALEQKTWTRQLHLATLSGGNGGRG